MPRISVVVPTYNRSLYIVDAIDSVLRQTFTDYEIIVIDDGSTDDTKNLLNPYADKIRYIFQENKGVSSARNAGIGAAKGEWIAFLDSDDLWLPEKLEKQVEALRDFNVIHFHKCEWFVDNKEDLALLKKCENIHWPITDRKGFVIDPVLSVVSSEPYMTPALLCHRSCFEKIGFFEEFLSAGEDEDWLSRASLTHKFHIIPDSLAMIRYHQRQTGLNSEKSIRSLIRVFERMSERFRDVHPAAWQISRKRLAGKKSHLSNLLFKQGDKVNAVVYAWASYIIEPYKIARLLKVVFFAMNLYSCKYMKKVIYRD